MPSPIDIRNRRGDLAADVRRHPLSLACSNTCRQLMSALATLKPSTPGYVRGRACIGLLVAVRRRQLSNESKKDQPPDGPTEEELRRAGSDFNVMAADSTASQTRRFNVSTGGNQTKATLFKDYTRKRYTSQYERETEHSTFLSHLPQAVHELESERPVLTKNPLIRDQHNVVIDKGDASHRRWLGGEGDHTTGNVFERQRQGTSARLSSAHDAVLRKKAGIMTPDGDMGVPEEGLNVEQKIQLAFAQGDFDNLKGKGRPLPRLDEGSSGQLFEDRTSHLFMDALAKTGHKPLWIERSGRIKTMTRLLGMRLQGELGRRLVSAAEGGGVLSASALASVREQWEGWAEGAGLVTRDLAYLNDDIDLYNLQVPSMSLQRLRLSLPVLLSSAYDDATLAFLTPVGAGSSFTVRSEAARAFVRQAERDGLMGPITCLATFRQDDDTAWRHHTMTAKPDPGRQGQAEGGGAGVIGALTSLFAGFLGGGGHKR